MLIQEIYTNICLSIVFKPDISLDPVCYTRSRAAILEQIALWGFLGKYAALNSKTDCVAGFF